MIPTFELENPKCRWGILISQNGSNEVSDLDLITILRNLMSYDINYKWDIHSSTGRESSDLSLDLKLPILIKSYWNRNLILSVCSWIEGSEKGCDILVFKLVVPPDISEITIQVNPPFGTALVTEFSLSCKSNITLKWKYSIGYIVSDENTANIDHYKCVWLDQKSMLEILLYLQNKEG